MATIHKCDTCQKSQNQSYDLSPVKDQYKSDEVKEVCPTCMKEIDAKIWEVRDRFKRLELILIQKYIKRMVTVSKQIIPQETFPGNE